MIYNFLISIYFLKSKISNHLLFKIFNIKYGDNFTVKGALFLKGKGSIEIGENVLINSNYFYNPIGGQTFTSMVVAKNAKLQIGNNVGLSNCAIFCSKEIIIEDFVFIGGDCKIYDTDFHSIYLADRKKIPEVGIKSAPIVIKTGAFIGAGSTVLKGVVIGENAVIAAASLVSKNVPTNEIWGGNPIKFIKKIEN